MPLRADRDQAWRDFAGWRVNYDIPLVTLAGLLVAPYAPWSSDRSIPFKVRIIRRPVTTSRRVARRRPSAGDGLERRGEADVLGVAVRRLGPVLVDDPARGSGRPR